MTSNAALVSPCAVLGDACGGAAEGEPATAASPPNVASGAAERDADAAGAAAGEGASDGDADGGAPADGDGATDGGSTDGSADAVAPPAAAAQVSENDWGGAPAPVGGSGAHTPTVPVVFSPICAGGAEPATTGPGHAPSGNRRASAGSPGDAPQSTTIPNDGESVKQLPSINVSARDDADDAHAGEPVKIVSVACSRL